MRRRQLYRKRDTIGIAMSGGKDSASLAHILNALRWRMRINVVGLHVNMGLGEFSDASQAAVEALCDSLSMDLHVASVADYGVRIEPVASFRQCNVCGAVRRALLNRLNTEHKIQVLATAHTLDDILLFMLKGILSGKMHAPKPMLAETTHRPRKVKPFYFTPETATEAYRELLDLPYTDMECTEFVPESHRFKKIFRMLEEMAPMGNIQFAKTMLRNMKTPKDDELERQCRMCGEPTNRHYCPLCALKRAQSDETGAVELCDEEV